MYQRGHHADSRLWLTYYHSYTHTFRTCACACSYNGFPVVRNEGGRDVFVGLIKRQLVLQTLQVTRRRAWPDRSVLALRENTNLATVSTFVVLHLATRVTTSKHVQVLPLPLITVTDPEIKSHRPHYWSHFPPYIHATAHAHSHHLLCDGSKCV